MKKDIADLAKKLKIKFRNLNLLTQAFVHRSYLNEHADFNLDHNERLEFLGDAVLELAVTEYLYAKYPNPEGELTNWRAALVNYKMLSRKAQELELNDYLLLSRGESKDNGRAREIILANTMEALIGAVYLDQGYDVSREFVEELIMPELPGILEKELFRDPKSKLQEIIQEKISVTPHYRVLKEDGPDHNKEFSVGVYIEDRLIGQGGGQSKQDAQVEAAAKALKVINQKDFWADLEHGKL